MSDDNIIRFPTILRIAPIQELHELLAPDIYTLSGHTPVRVKSAHEWGREWGRRARLADAGTDPWRVAFTEIGRGVSVSTVFLGLNHRFFGDGPPLLFETMIFGGALDEYQNRCSTWEEAEHMHGEAVQRIKRGHLKLV